MALITPTDINTVTQDKTPTAIHMTQQPGYEVPDVHCAGCGRGVMMTETCWMWQGLTFCDSQTCKPVRGR